MQGGDGGPDLRGASASVAPTTRFAERPAAVEGGRPAVFSPGEVVAGRFRIVRFLAAGGMGEVFEAWDLELQERVALKTIRPEIARSPETMERFRREVQLARRVTHRSVCRTFDLFRHELPLEPGVDGPPPSVAFVSMELLEGETLARRLERTGPLPPERAFPIVRQIAEALSVAHDLGIVHRDLKAANVTLVPEDGGGDRTVVTDFGLARLRGGPDGSGATLTATGVVMGTPACMAPEQITGGEITPATDVYAFGVLLYEMVTGRQPFEGDDPLTVTLKRLREAPASPRLLTPGLDARWEEAILRCLELEPSARFASCRELLAALEGTRRTRRSVARPVVGALLLLLPLGAGLTWLLVARRPERTAGETVPGSGRSAVAVLGFRNLAGRPDDAWLSGALAEMLSTELGAGDGLRTVPGEDVARMRLELALPDAASLGAQTLSRIYRHLGADHIVTGSYVVAGDPASPRLRLDVRVESRSGRPGLAFTDEAPQGQLLDLVARAGGRLRSELGGGTVPDALAGSVRAARPRDPTAARLYAEGLEKLRTFDALAARDLFLKAAEREPDNALLRSAVSQAWSALGHDAEAVAWARRAREAAGNLSRRDRLVIEARYQQAARAWPEAEAAWSELRRLYPDDVEYGLRLAAVQREAGHAPACFATLAALRSLLPPAGEDPRIDLEEATTANGVGDFPRMRLAAARAAERGKALGARWLQGRAQLLLARAFWRLGESDASLSAGATARDLFVAVGDAAGEAELLNLFGNVATNGGREAEADAHYTRALEINRRIGNQSGVVAVLGNQAILRRRGKDLPAARTLLVEALSLARTIDDRRGVLLSLNNLAVVLRYQDDLDGALALYREALALAEANADQQGTSAALNNSAIILSLQGKLEEAKAAHSRSLELARATGEQQAIARRLSNIAEIALRMGDSAEARACLVEALEILVRLDLKGRAATVENDLAAFELDAGRPGEAERRAAAAAERAAAAGEADEEAVAWAVRALALLRLERVADAVPAEQRAREKIGEKSLPRARCFARRATAALRENRGEARAAVRELERAVQDAGKGEKAPGLLFETRLWLVEQLRRSGRPAEAERAAAALARDATAASYPAIAAAARRFQGR